MARQPRIALAGRPHLVVQSTTLESGAFVDDDDRRLYRDAMFESSRDVGVAVHAYAMANRRVQLLVTPKSAVALGQFMQRLGRRYVAAFNQRHLATGRLWNSRFGSAALLSECFLLPAQIMTEQLPVRDGCVAASDCWEWSSAAHHTGSRPDARVEDLGVYWAMGNTPFERQARYALRLMSVLDAKETHELAKATRTGWPLGSVEEIKGAEQLVEGLSLRPNPRGRPRRTCP